MLTQERKPDADSEPTICLEEVILRIVDDYVRSKLRDKYQLEWSKLTNEAEKHAYSEKREAIGKEVFYAIRSRTGDDFINYFASTVCSVPHWMDQKQFVALSKELYSNTEKIRTLTMLALSARVARNTETKQGDK
jgi:CRISPR-associated protein Cmx8